MTVASRLQAAVSGVASRFVEYQINRLVVLAAPPPTPLPELAPGYHLVRANPAVRALLAAHPDRTVAKSASFLGPTAHGFVLLAGDEVAAVAVFHGAHAFEAHPVWRLRSGEAALVELVTASAHRGRSLATKLIAHASAAMFAAESTRLVSWMWWSNTLSFRAFIRAGYSDAGWQVGVRPPGRKQMMGLRLVRAHARRMRWPAIAG